jgi:hypothetical protein
MDCNADEEDLGMYMCVDGKDSDGNPVTIDLVEVSCVCVCVCVVCTYVCVYVCVCSYVVYIHACACMYTHIHTHTHTQNGRDKEVTEANKADFVDRMVHWRLVDRVAVQMDALVAGFHSVSP